MSALQLVKDGKYKYSWSKSFSVPAQVVGETLERLPRKTPEAFIAASRARGAPTHGLFEWNNTAAAEQYRLLQARIIINSLQVEIQSVRGKPQVVSAFIGSSDRGSYTATLEATDEELNDAEMRCVEDMNRFRARYRTLQIAREVVAVMGRVAARASRSKRKVARKRA